MSYSQYHSHTLVGGISLLGGLEDASEDEHRVTLASGQRVNVLLDFYTAHITVQTAANVGGALATVLGQEGRTTIVGVSTAG